MARYIDADALIKKIFPYDAVNKKDYAINAKAVADAIDNTPTADVVQRAVVEELKKDRYQILPDGKIELLPRSDVKALKKEVAWEIFEAIYKSVASKIPMEIRPIFKDDRDFDAGFINGKRDALLDVLVLVAELKKKYTEDNNDG